MAVRVAEEAGGAEHWLGEQNTLASSQPARQCFENPQVYDIPLGCMIITYLVDLMPIWLNLNLADRRLQGTSFKDRIALYSQTDATSHSFLSYE